MDSHKISPEQHEVLRSMEKITVRDVKDIMQKLSSGKIQTPKVGKLQIVNKFIPILRSKDTSELINHEERYVFFAVEKTKTSFFSKASYRVFIWPFLSETIFVVPTESVIFNAVEPKIEQRERPVFCRSYERKTRYYDLYYEYEYVPITVISCFEKYSVKVWPTQTVSLLKVEKEKQTDFAENLESCEFARQFTVEQNCITALKDFASYYRREKSGGCRGYEQQREPMYYLRHGFVLD